MRIVLALVLVFLIAGPSHADEEVPLARIEKVLLDPPATGLVVTGVVEGTQASVQGVRTGDVIVAYDGQPTPTYEELRELVLKAAEKEAVEMVYLRRIGEKVTVSLAPGRIGVNLIAVEKGKGAPPLPPATSVRFDFSLLVETPHDDWYAFSVDGTTKPGFEHGTLRLEDGKLIVRHELALDWGDESGLHHVDVSVVASAEPIPNAQSQRFEFPLARFLNEGTLHSHEDGRREWRVTYRTGDGEPIGHSQVLPAGLPVIPTYLAGQLASFMPRQTGACFHFRRAVDTRDDLMLSSCLHVVGEEELEIDGQTHKTWRVELQILGRPFRITYWVDAARGPVRIQYSRGPVATRTTKEEALKDLHHGIVPRTRTAD